MPSVSVKQFEQFKQGNGNYIIDENFFKKLLSKNQKTVSKPSKKGKRALSAYFLWLNDNRSNIKETYFSDFNSVTDWSRENKKQYYESKGLQCPMTDSKPKIVSLITKKAGMLWKEVDQSEKNRYKEKAQLLKEESGTSKTNDNSDSFIDNENDDNDEDVLETITFNDKSYNYNCNTHNVYDIDSGEHVAKFDGEQMVFIK